MSNDVKIDLVNLMEVLQQEIDDVQTSLEILSTCAESLDATSSPTLLELARSLERNYKVCLQLLTQSQK